MDKRLHNFYLEARVNSASPGQLLIMLYDALVENAELAEANIAAPENLQDRSKAAQSVTRCIDIITELSTSLRPGVDPTLCATLSNLYCFFTRELSDALDKSDPAKIRGILPLLRDLRNTWNKALKLSSQAQPIPVAA